MFTSGSFVLLLFFIIAPVTLPAHHADSFEQELSSFFDQIRVSHSREMISTFQNSPERDLSVTGAEILNTIRKEIGARSPLLTMFAHNGVTDRVEAAEIVLFTFWRTLNRQPMGLEQQIIGSVKRTARWHAQVVAETRRGELVMVLAIAALMISGILAVYLFSAILE